MASNPFVLVTVLIVMTKDLTGAMWRRKGFVSQWKVNTGEP